MDTNWAVPELSNVSYLVPALTHTEIEANGDKLFSVATFTPFANVVKLNGKSNSNASGIMPCGNSPKSVNFALENYK